MKFRHSTPGDSIGQGNRQSTAWPPRRSWAVWPRGWATKFGVDMRGFPIAPEGRQAPSVRVTNLKHSHDLLTCMGFLSTWFSHPLAALDAQMRTRPRGIGDRMARYSAASPWFVPTGGPIAPLLPIVPCSGRHPTPERYPPTRQFLLDRVGPGHSSTHLSPPPDLVW